MTGTAPQRPKADPQMVTCFQCRGDGTCFATDDPCPVCGGLGSITDDAAPVPQTEGEDHCEKCGLHYNFCPCDGLTEGECPDCEDGTLYDPDALPLAPTVPCPTCSGTGKDKA